MLDKHSIFKALFRRLLLVYYNLEDWNMRKIGNCGQASSNNKKVLVLTRRQAATSARWTGGYLRSTHWWKHPFKIIKDGKAGRLGLGEHFFGEQDRLWNQTGTSSEGSNSRFLWSQ